LRIYLRPPPELRPLPPEDPDELLELDEEPTEEERVEELS
jgi:hypothetical protein